MTVQKTPTKHLTCVVPDCQWTGSAPTEDELMTKVAAHATHDHGLSEIPAELEARVKAAIETR